MKKIIAFVLILAIIAAIFLLRPKKELTIIQPDNIPIKEEVKNEPKEENKIEQKTENKVEKKEEQKKEEPKKDDTKYEQKQIKVVTKLPTKASVTNKKITFDSSFPSPEKDWISAKLKEFFERYYNILANLNYKDISDMFSNQEYAYIYKTALELLIENRKMGSLDLTLTNPEYELKVTGYKNSDDKISFTVSENCSYYFKATKNYKTAVYNIENKFTFVKEEDEYKISYYNKVQDFYVMITDVYKTTENYQEELNRIKNDYLNKFTTQNKTLATMRSNYLNGNYTTKKCDHTYNREDAYNYALTWVGRRNTTNWHTYSANCVNFVSQVMYAGGIPMDYSGSYQWKWYGTKKNTKNTASGFVYSWTYVPSIVSYFQNNTGYGLCGKYNENLYLGDKGDVIVVGTKGPTRHVVSVVGQIKDENGKVVDLLVNSNTVDLEYFPLSAYAYPYKVLMKVYGWND